jgi:hypothetical protein
MNSKLSRRLILALALTLSAFTRGSFAADGSDFAPSGALKVFWGCQFDAKTEKATGLACVDLEHYFFDSNSKEVSESTDANDTDLQVSITAQARPGNLHRYYVSFVASARFETPPITLPWLDIDDAVSLGNRRTALQTRILSGVRLYQTTLTLGNSPVPSENTEFPFYLDAGLSGSGSAAGDVKSSNLTGSMSASYFPKKDRFRFDVAGSGSWISQSIPGASGPLRGDLIATDVTVTGLYSFDAKKRWSVAVVTDNGAAAGANLKSYGGYETGVEYILVPFLTDQTHQISIRAGSAWSQLSLVNPNSLGHLQENVMSALAQIVYVNEFAHGKMNLTAHAKVQDYLGRTGFNQYSGGATISYRIGRKIVLNATATYQQMKNSLSYPGQLDYSNPAQLLFLGNAPGSNYTYSFGAKLTLGRTSKRTNDGRWTK